MTCLRPLLRAFLLWLGLATTVMAGPYEDALPKFAADTYS